MTVKTRKYSQFDSKGTLDEAVGLESGENSRSTDTGGGGSGDGATIWDVNQPGHGLDRGQWVRFDGSNYVIALANTPTNAEVVAVVNERLDADNIRLQQAGEIEDLSAQVGTAHTYLPLTPGEAYFLSETITGEISTTKPSTNIDSVEAPCLMATSTTGGLILPLGRGQINDNGGSVRTVPGGNKYEFTQAGHGFSVGDFLRVDSASTHTEAQANSFTNAQSVGMVVETPVDGDADKFIIQTEGFTDVLSGLSGTVPVLFWLDPSTPGAMTSTKPTGGGEYRKPVFVSYTSGSGYILEQKQEPVLDTDSPNFLIVNQASPTLSVGDPVYLSAANTLALAQGDTKAKSQSIGFVVHKDGNNYTVQFQGYTDKITTASAATTWYLDPSSAGALTSSDASSTGQISRPIFQSNTTGDGFILPQRPLEFPYDGGGGGGSGGGTTLVDTNLTASSTYTTFDNILSNTYDYYEFYILDAELSSQGQIAAQLGKGAGPTYDTGANYNNSTIHSRNGNFNADFLYPQMALSGVSGSPPYIFHQFNVLKLDIEGKIFKASDASRTKITTTISGGPAGAGSNLESAVVKTAHNDASAQNSIRFKAINTNGSSLTFVGGRVIIIGKTW